MTSHTGQGFLSIFFGDKYDLIQLNRQIIHQYSRNYFFTTKLSSLPLSKLRENNENDMTSVVWAVIVFGPSVWQLSARCH